MPLRLTKTTNFERKSLESTTEN